MVSLEQSCEAEGRLEELLPPWPSPTSCRCLPKKPLAPPLPMLCVGGRSGDGLLLKPNSLVVGLGGAREKQGCRVEMTLLPRLQVCFALILYFICFHNPRGRTREAWQGGTNRETHRPSPGLGPEADRRRGSESFLGGQGRASEGVASLGCRTAELTSLGRDLRVGGPGRQPPFQLLGAVVLHVL